MKKKIPIFFAVDDNYVKYLRIAISSLKEKANRQFKYEIIILHNGLSQESKSLISKLKSSHFRIRFDNVSGEIESISSRLKVRDYYTLTTYYRLLIPNRYIFMDKALYLDADIIVRDDISKLYFEDMADNYLAAVPDQSVSIIPEFSEYVEKALHIKKEKYFNAGILVMNLKRLREVHFLRQVVNISKNVMFKVAQDQDLLNVLSKDHVQYLSLDWNTMPLGEKRNNPHIIHYNLIYKPWKRKDVMYEEYFFLYAEKIGLRDEIIDSRDSIPLCAIEKENEGMENLKKLCTIESLHKSVYEKAVKENIMNEESIMKSLQNVERGKILEKISELEKNGLFDQDVENDPPYTPLHAGDVDYKHKKLITRIKAFFTIKVAFKYFNKMIKKGVITIDDYIGLDNLKNLKSGAIITLNHFSPFDSIPIHKATKKYAPKRTLFKIIKEGNFTYPGLYGKFFRNCYTLPLAHDYDLMKEMMSSVDYWLKKGKLILIYPEQSMWWNYRKPKPLKIGAFKFAAKSNVPIIPTFITMRDLTELDSDGYNKQAYTLHIESPIYPNHLLSINENAKIMKEENEKVWKRIYESTYGIPLKYGETVK